VDKPPVLPAACSQYYSVRYYEPCRGPVRSITMSKTYTPELTPEVLERLRDYAQIFYEDYRHKTQAAWSGIYLHGLLQDGERKSIEPLSRRVPLPPDHRVKDPEQALQQFVNHSPWDEQKVAQLYRKHRAQTFASPDGSSSSTTRLTPNRASTPSASSDNTAGSWARRPTASAPSKSITSAPRGTTPWPSGCPCLSPGPRSGSGSNRPAFPSLSKRSRPRGRSL
jgi:hypothetical protein